MTVQRAVVKSAVKGGWLRLCALGMFVATMPAAVLLAIDVGGAATQPAAATVPATTRSAEQRKQDDIARVMEFFRVTQPDVWEQAKSLHENDPPKFDKLISAALMTVNRMEGIKRRNPKLFELSMRDLQLNYQSMRIAMELKKPGLPESERKGLILQLEPVLAAEFDVQQEIRKLEIEDLRKKVTDLDTAVHARQDDKEKVLRKRLDDLVERMPRLDW